MKHLLLALFVLIASMPVEASVCDMPAGPQVNDSMSHDGHHGMDMTDSEPMDCCDTDSEGLGVDCAMDMDCNTCTTGVITLQDAADVASVLQASRLQTVVADALPRLARTPLLRPPIT